MHFSRRLPNPITVTIAMIVALCGSCSPPPPAPHPTPPIVNLGSADLFDQADRTSPDAPTSWYCFYDMPEDKKEEELSVCQRSKNFCNDLRNDLVKTYPSTPKSSCVLSVVATTKVYYFDLMKKGEGKRSIGTFSPKACDWWAIAFAKNIDLLETPEERSKWAIKRNDCPKYGAP